jgi:hypothetical protein
MKKIKMIAQAPKAPAKTPTLNPALAAKVRAMSKAVHDGLKGK